MLRKLHRLFRIPLRKRFPAKFYSMAAWCKKSDASGFLLPAVCGTPHKADIQTVWQSLDRPFRTLPH